MHSQAVRRSRRNRAARTIAIATAAARRRRYFVPPRAPHDIHPVDAQIKRLADQLRAAQAANPNSLIGRWWLQGSGGELWIQPAPDSVEDAEPVPVKRRKQADIARQAALPPTLPPRLIGRDAAAAYVGVSPNTFDKMVADGLMPNPRRLTERRLAWDVRQLDAAIDRLPIDGDADAADTDDTTDHSWDDIDAQAKTKPAVH